MLMQLTPKNMSKNVVINFEGLSELRAKGMSNQAIANKYKVSKRTVERGFQTGGTAPEVLDFAAKLEKLIAEAPNGLCRKELQRTICAMRTRHNVSRDGRKAQILKAISTGAQTVEDIADDLQLNREDLNVYRDELTEILDELIVAGKIRKQAPGGIANRGRKLKFKFFIVV